MQCFSLKCFNRQVEIVGSPELVTCRAIKATGGRVARERRLASGHGQGEGQREGPSSVRTELKIWSYAVTRQTARRSKWGIELLVL